MSQGKYNRLLGGAHAVGAERDYYQGQIQQFWKDMSTAKTMRQTTQQLFSPYLPVPRIETK